MQTPPVLIVEDDEDIRESLQDFLQDHGYPTIGAVNGRDGLKRLAASDLRPCAIILDLMMPVMDGRAFREEQLRSPALAEIPTILISAHNDVAGPWADAGITHRLPKPLNLSTLLQILRQLSAPAQESRAPG